MTTLSPWPTVHRFAWPVSAIVALAYMAWRAPGWIDSPHWYYDLSPVLAGLCAIAAGYAMTMIGTLTRNFYCSWQLGHQFQWPRAALAGVMTALTPFVFIHFIPIPAAVVPVVLMGGGNVPFWTWPILALTGVFWYAMLTFAKACAGEDGPARPGIVALVYAGVSAAVLLATSTRLFV